MEILNIIDPVRFKTYMMVLMRISILLVMFPIFSSNVFPALVKTGLAMVLSLVLYTVVPVDLDRFPPDTVSTGLMIGAEALIGLILGLILRIFLGAIQLAGQIIGFQMGFAMINVVDPQTGANVSIMDQLGYWVAVVIFLVLNGHHVMISALADSFELVPVGYLMMPPAIMAKMMALMAHLFLLAIKIGAPVIAALMFVSAGFGLVAKFSPQMNVMIVAFPLKIVVGLFLFGLSLDIIAIIIRDFIPEFKKILLYLLYFMGGG